MDKLSPVIEASGYGLAGNIGGLPRQTYYTPDGRIIRAIVATREYIKRDKDGKVIETGTRDANFDKGWLPVMPTELKLYCSGCNKWHETQREVDICVEGKKKLVNSLATKEIQKNTDEMDALRKEVAELKEILQKAVQNR